MPRANLCIKTGSLPTFEFGSFPGRTNQLSGSQSALCDARFCLHFQNDKFLIEFVREVNWSIGRASLQARRTDHLQWWIPEKTQRKHSCFSIRRVADVTCYSEFMNNKQTLKLCGMSCDSEMKQTQPRLLWHCLIKKKLKQIMTAPKSCGITALAKIASNCHTIMCALCKFQSFTPPLFCFQRGTASLVVMISVWFVENATAKNIRI